MQKYFIATALAAGTVYAGAVAQELNDDATSSETRKLNTVTVTAQRREQSLQDAPVAVTALPEEALEQLNVSDAQDLMSVVPGLQVSTQTAADGGGSATFFLRGLGQQRAGNGSEPAIGIYVDDFYYPSLFGTIFDIVDIAQVEVLRGPQGTLFGRNTIGGAIRYSTKRANVDESSGSLKGAIGNYDRYELSGSLNLPLGSKAALRLTAGHLEQAGYVDIETREDDAGASETDLVRVQLRVEPTDSIYFDLSSQWSNFRLDGFTYNNPGPMTPVPPLTGASPTLPFIYNSAVAPAMNLPLYTDAYASDCFYCQYGTLNEEFSETTFKNALATIGWEIVEGWELKSLTGWQQVENQNSNDLDSTPLLVFGGGQNNSEFEAISQEFQLNGRAFEDRLDFVSGLYYYQEEQPGLAPDRFNTILGNPSPPTTYQDRELHSYAAYVDGSFDLTSRLSILGGYRYSEDEKKTLVTSVADNSEVAFNEATFSSDTYRMGVQYEWTPDIMTYANVSTGFRGGGFNPYSAVQTPALRPFDPEESTSYEIGARMQFFAQRFTFNPTAFFVDWNKIQVQAATTDDAGNVIIALQNAGKAESKGVEIEWTANLTDTFRLFGNVAYLDMKYTDIGTATGITLDSGFQRAPEWTYAIGASKTFDLSSGAQVVSTLNYNFQDEQYSTPTDADTLMLESYSILNGRVEFNSPDSTYSIAIFANNILDEEYAIGGVNYYANVGAARYDLGRPRQYGISARVQF